MIPGTMPFTSASTLHALSGRKRSSLGAAIVAAMAGLTACACQPARPARNIQYDLRQTVASDLLRQANRGRDILRDDGYLRFPWWIKTVWVDVGAHHIETTRQTWESRRTLGLVAVEPMSQCWTVWPDSRRLLGIPAAIYLERGTMDFHVNANDGTSSLAASAEGTGMDVLRTVEVRKVPVLRLEDVLEAIPDDLVIEYLKTDTQGADLQVLQSAGEQLRRVRRVRAEIINRRLYDGIAGQPAGNEKEFVDFMSSMGFRFVSDEQIASKRAWLDKVFVNTTPAER
jgi:FkbM family methyltransferase